METASICYSLKISCNCGDYISFLLQVSLGKETTNRRKLRPKMVVTAQEWAWTPRPY